MIGVCEGSKSQINVCKYYLGSQNSIMVIRLISHVELSPWVSSPLPCPSFGPLPTL